MMTTVKDYKNSRGKFLLKLKRGEEAAPEITNTLADLELPLIKTKHAENRITPEILKNRSEETANKELV